MTVVSEIEIIHSIRKGNQQPLETIYVEHFPMIRDYILKNSGSEIEAKDVYQDGMIILHEKLMDPSFLLTAKISSFLFSICRNLWLKQLRERKKQPKTALDENHDFVPDMVDDYLENELRLKAIMNGIKEMGDSCKKILNMFFFEKASMREIAEKLGYTNEANAKNQKYKCMKKLKLKVIKVG